jgi:hypothetical protein
VLEGVLVREERQIGGISDLLEAAKFVAERSELALPWWRGQASSQWDLAPGVFREDKQTKEQDLANRFMLGARSRYAECPGPDEWAEWVFLMQHYGLPTRLLDWTEAPLVALYFAVNEGGHDGEDGAVWALCPAELHTTQDVPRFIQMPCSSTVEPLFGNVFSRYAEAETKTLAVGTSQRDARQMVQQSAFTIHGSTTPLNQLPKAETFLYKFVIPKEHKENTRRNLGCLGINRSWLFPDLQNLAVHLVDAVCRGL